MMDWRTFCVAGHAFSVRCPERFLSSYEPFAVEKMPTLFDLQVIPEEDLSPLLAPHELILRCNEEPPYLWLYKNTTEPDKDDVHFGFSLNGNECVSLLKLPRNLEGGACTLHVRRRIIRSELECCINNSLMLLFTIYTTLRGTLMIHSSVTVCEGKGYAFLGKSGTGKSTHSSLWLKYIPGTWLLNDDNPVVRVLEDGSVRIYGSPWSGKTPCYKNESVPLGGIVRLAQAPYNEIRRLVGLSAYAAFLPSCSSIKWKRSLEDALYKTVENVVSSVGVWDLDCLPDEAAARLCHQNVTTL